MTRRADRVPWPKLFVNLRSTRVAELCESFPSHVVASWAGHSEQIAQRHYLQTTEAHFEKAVQNPVQYGAERGRTGPQSERGEKPETAFFGLGQGVATLGNKLSNVGMGPVGLEPTTSRL